jgi:hypothetical protein
MSNKKSDGTTDKSRRLRYFRWKMDSYGLGILSLNWWWDTH